MAQDRFDWLILAVAGAIVSILLLAITAYNAIAG
jgi:hypothetical protein